MARITNSRSRYIEHIEKELIQSPELFEVCYVEMCSLLTYAYAILFSNKNQTLTLRLWDADVDNIRFRLGIFDLDSLSISSSKIYLNNQSREHLQSLADAELSVGQLGSVVLDGVTYQLFKDSSHLTWKLPTQINWQLEELVKELKSNAKLLLWNKYG